jgi:hypothetical protein
MSDKVPGAIPAPAMLAKEAISQLVSELGRLPFCFQAFLAPTDMQAGSNR